MTTQIHHKSERKKLHDLRSPAGSGQGEYDHNKEGISVVPPARVNAPEADLDRF
jgi:hypothetical protein